MSKLLIITSRPDTHVDIVLKLLPNIEYSVIDPASYPNMDMSYAYSGSSTLNKINGVTLNDVKVVWFRKPFIGSEIGSNYPEIYRESVRDNYKAWIEYYYSLFADAYWISPRWSIANANSKLLQMELALDIGFDLPKTLVTSNFDDAKEFIHNGFDTVIKPIYTNYVNIDGRYKTMFTSDVNINTTDLSGISRFPCIIQEKILGVDFRVTVVGETIHMYKITKKPKFQEETDWRRFQVNSGLVYNYIENIPVDLSTKCFQMVKRLNLNYAAFDFIQTDKGKFYFLEVNPNGQWAFAEETDSGPITQAMASLILSKLNTC